MSRMVWVGGVVMFFAAGAGTFVAGQEVYVGGGAASYDLSGVGTSWVAAARYGHPLAARISLEAGTTVFGYETQGADRRVFLMPEAGVTANLPAGPTVVHFSLGGGLSFAVKGNDETEPTLFAGLAVDLPGTGAVRLRPGVRYRAVDPWTGTVFEYTLGVRIGGGS